MTKRPWRYLFLANLYNSIALVNKLRRLKCWYFLSHFVFTIIFRFLRTLLITLILYKRYMCGLMKFQNKSPHKYIAYSLASYYLNLIRSGIQWIKSKDSTANVVSVFPHLPLFLLSHEMFVGNFQFSWGRQSHCE